MADFARWATECDPAPGPAGKAAVEDVIANDPVAVCVRHRIFISWKCTLDIETSTTLCFDA